MIEIIYPEQLPSTRMLRGRQEVFCAVRKKWFLLTPEEWVRQNMIGYMHRSLGYPLKLMAIEKQMQLGELKKRFDIAVYKDIKPWLLIECKEPGIPIDQRTLDQALRYNMQLQAPFFMISNGNETYGFAKQNGEMISLEKFPGFL